MPHITYDYTVPRTPPLRTAAPAVDRPLYRHLPETSQSHPIPADSRAAQDLNATWLSLSPDDTSEQLPLREGQEDLGFGHPHLIQINSTSQTRDWGWEQSEEKKYDFQIRQVYHTNTAGEEEEEEAAAVGRETELGWLLCFSFCPILFAESRHPTLVFLNSKVALPQGRQERMTISSGMETPRASSASSSARDRELGEGSHGTDQAVSSRAVPRDLSLASRAVTATGPSNRSLMVR